MFTATNPKRIYGDSVDSIETQHSFSFRALWFDTLKASWRSFVLNLFPNGSIEIWDATENRAFLKQNQEESAGILETSKPSKTKWHFRDFVNGNRLEINRRSFYSFSFPETSTAKEMFKLHLRCFVLVRIPKNGSFVEDYNHLLNFSQLKSGGESSEFPELQYMCKSFLSAPAIRKNMKKIISVNNGFVKDLHTSKSDNYLCILLIVPPKLDWKQVEKLENVEALALETEENLTNFWSVVNPLFNLPIAELCDSEKHSWSEELHECDLDPSGKKLAYSQSVIGAEKMRREKLQIEMNTSSCCLIFPEAVRHLGKLIEKIESAGFKITNIRCDKMSVREGKEFFKRYDGILEDYAQLALQACEGPVVMLTAQHLGSAGTSLESSVLKFKELRGHMTEAVPCSPESLRGTLKALGVVPTQIHCTEIPDEAQFERDFMFRVFV